ncbi:lachesin-like isoform X3 [Stegodyphus dumicola]|uniref:lachesin-like isoform X3 n=1 Tax=Stegodyphus dumicola TaxID=202533 RepID=UPI0015A91CA9|nr:lachesin-like isoform X3 [Stegodyphus dumicola]
MYVPKLVFYLLISAVKLFAVYGQQNPTISYITKEQYANIGDSIDLVCSVHYATGYPVLWVKIDKNGRNSIISTGSTQLIPDQRYSIRHDDASNSYTLQITKLQKVDSGLYQCQVLIGPTSKLAEDAWLHVKIPPVILDNSTQSVQTTSGATVYLNCYARGSPEPEISWRRENNDILPTGGAVFRGNILAIHNISKRDRGTYYCIAENGVGKGARRHVGVEVELVLNTDSQAAIQWINCSRSFTKSRHMNLGFHFMKDLTKDNVIKLEYSQTDNMIADFLTKSFSEEKLMYTLKIISLIS